MLNTQDSRSSFSLDALLGNQLEVEEPDADERQSEERAAASAPDLLGMLGLAPEPPRVEEAESPIEAGPASAPVDLHALLGLEEERERDQAVTPDAMKTEPVVPLALDVLTVGARHADEAIDEEPTEASPKQTVRSRFVDAPAFRPPASHEESVGPEEAPAPRVSSPASAALLAIPVTPAVRYLAGECRPLELPERLPAQEPVSSSIGKAQPAQPAQSAKPSQSAQPAQSAKPAKPALPAQPVGPVKPSQPVEPAQPSQPVEPSQPAKPVQPAQPSQPAPVQQSARQQPPRPTPSPLAPSAQAEPPEKPQPQQPSATDAKPERSAAAKPSSVSKASTSTSPKRRPSASPSHPVSTERAARSGKRTGGIWYLLSACLFALAIACTCYAVYAAVHDERATPPAPIAVNAESASGERQFRYAVQDADGSTRAVEETARFDVDGLVAESTISFKAESETEAAQVLEDAEARFGDAWVSGSVQDGKAVFTVKHEGEGLDREAYAALLEASTLDCETIG